MIKFSACILTFSFALISCGGGSSIIGSATTEPVDPPTGSEAELRRQFENFREFQNQPALNQVKAQYAYARGATGRGVVIGMVDNGIDQSHPEFSGGKILDESWNAGEYTPMLDTCFQRNLNTGVCQDEIPSHGTTVGGVMVANRGTTDRSLPIHGIAFDSRLLSAGIRLGTGRPVYHSGSIPETQPTSFDSFSADIFNRLNRRADVVNLSFARTYGITGTSRDRLLTVYPEMIEALKQTNRPASERTVYVWSAGNAGLISNIEIKSSVLLYSGMPYRIPELQGHSLAVVAIDNTGNIANYSNHCGVAKEFCLAAPGTVSGPAANIICDPQMVAGSNQGCYVRRVRGTSFASPLVAGGFALLKQHYRDQLGNDEIVERLLETANDDGNYANEDIYGHGLMDLDAATRPHGTTRILTGDHLSGNFEQASISSLSLTPAIGDAFDYALSNREIAVFDSLDAPFFRPFAEYVHTVPASAIQLKNRLANFGTVPSEFHWNRGDLEFRTQLQQSSNETSSIVRQKSSLHSPSSNRNFSEAEIRMFSMSRRHENHESYFGFRTHPGWQFGLYSIGALKPNMFSDDSAFTNPLFSMVRNGALAGISFESSQHTQSGINFATFAGKSQYGLQRDAESDLSHGVVVEFTTGKGEQSGIGFQFGILQEPNGLIGSHSSGAFGGLNATTGFAGVSVHKTTESQWKLMANLYGGVSRTGASQRGMLRDITSLAMSSFDAGVVKNGIFLRGDRLAVRLSQPLRVESGQARIRWASGRSRDRQVRIEEEQISLVPTSRQLDLEFNYQRSWRKGNLNLATIASRGKGHSRGKNDITLLMRFDRSF